MALEQRDEHRQQATYYLERNGALREAVGACGCDELTLRYLGVGEHNLNYRLDVASTGRTYVLRINLVPQPFHDDQVAYEFGALKALESSGRTPRPVYVDNGADAPGNGALVISFCEGDQLDFDHLRPGDMHCAAQLMADVHAVPVQKDCSVFKPRDPLRTLFDECLNRFKVYRASAYEDARVTRWIESFVHAAESSLATACRPEDCTHIINTEPLPSHFLIPAQSAADAAIARSTDGRFCETPGYFIDWERPIIGEVAQDVAYFVSPTTSFWDSEYLFPSADVEEFVESYWRAVDGRFARGSFDKRFRAYRMMTVLRSATWFCKSLGAYTAGEGHMTKKTMRKLPVYLSDEFMEMLARDCFA